MIAKWIQLFLNVQRISHSFRLADTVDKLPKPPRVRLLQREFLSRQRVCFVRICNDILRECKALGEECASETFTKPLYVNFNRHREEA